MNFVVALAVLQCRLTADEAVHAATAGGAAALRRTDVGAVGAGRARRPARARRTGHDYLAYRPGVPLTHAVFAGGVRVV